MTPDAWENNIKNIPIIQFKLAMVIIIDFIILYRLYREILYSSLSHAVLFPPITTQLPFSRQLKAERSFTPPGQTVKLPTQGNFHCSNSPPKAYISQ
jgi:hypothetical protein